MKIVVQDTRWSINASPIYPLVNFGHDPKYRSFYSISFSSYNFWLKIQKIFWLCIWSMEYLVDGATGRQIVD